MLVTPRAIRGNQRQFEAIRGNQLMLVTASRSTNCHTLSLMRRCQKAHMNRYWEREAARRRPVERAKRRSMCSGVEASPLPFGTRRMASTSPNPSCARGNQWQSVAISGNQWQSVAISSPNPSCARRSEVIRGNLWQSEAIRGNQWQSVAIRSDKRQSVAIRGN